MNILPLTRRVQVIASLVEGNSINSTVRMTRVAKHRVLKLLEDIGCACARLHDRKIRAVRASGKIARSLLRLRASTRGSFASNTVDILCLRGRSARRNDRRDEWRKSALGIPRDESDTRVYLPASRLRKCSISRVRSLRLGLDCSALIFT